MSDNADCIDSELLRLGHGGALSCAEGETGMPQSLRCLRQWDIDGQCSLGSLEHEAESARHASDYQSLASPSTFL